MKFYDVTYVFDDEMHERLSVLAERFAKIKGWNENETLQFAVTATSKNDIKEKLNFLEGEIISLEEKWQKQKEEKPGQKKVYISDEEREKCRKVADAYAEELDDAEIMVVDAGRYGFVKLIYYKFPYGFDNAIAYTNSLELFLDLWDEWLEAQLIKLTKNTPMAEMDYEDMFKCLPKGEQEKIMAKREYFAEKAELRMG